MLGHVHLFVILWTVAHQAPVSMGFCRQEYWSWLPFPPPRLSLTRDISVLAIQKTKIMASVPITSWQIDGETVADYFSGLQNHCRW